MCMVLMNQLLLLTNKNVTGLMRSVKQNVSCNYLDASNFRDIFKSEKPFEHLESKLNLENNNLEKENVSLLRGIPHTFNKPIFDKRSVT